MDSEDDHGPIRSTITLAMIITNFDTLSVTVTEFETEMLPTYRDVNVQATLQPVQSLPLEWAAWSSGYFFNFIQLYSSKDQKITRVTDQVNEENDQLYISAARESDY